MLKNLNIYVRMRRSRTEQNLENAYALIRQVWVLNNDKTKIPKQLTKSSFIYRFVESQ